MTVTVTVPGPSQLDLKFQVHVPVTVTVQRSLTEDSHRDAGRARLRTSHCRGWNRAAVTAGGSSGPLSLSRRRGRRRLAVKSGDSQSESNASVTPTAVTVTGIVGGQPVSKSVDILLLVLLRVG